jgi:hypothetical protein
MKKTNNKKTIFNNLWAIVMKKLNNSGVFAPYTKLSVESQRMFDKMSYVYPYTPLPNVETFRITFLHPHDKILKKSNIIKRVKEAEKESTPYMNKSMNRYVRHQFSTLNKNRNNPRKFWKIAYQLMTHSHSYKTICFNHVFKGWHRKYKYHVVKNILKSFWELNKKKYQYKITLIPKPNGESRPLGIPTPAWRVYLHGMNNILMVWLSPYVHPEQHGFYPGRGTYTAWKSVTKKLTYRSIYEYDMKKFFDTVNLDYLGDILKKTGIPKDVVDLLIKWNRTLPYKGPRHGLSWQSPMEEASDYKYHEIREVLHGFNDYTYWINKKRITEIQKPHLKHYEYYRGVSQGMPISPLLSSIILAPCLQKGNMDMVLYADDGILFSNEPRVIPPILPIESGLRYNLKKCGNIKVNNHYQTPIKFLGVKYTHDERTISDKLCYQGTLESSTRNLTSPFSLSLLERFKEAGYHLSYEGKLSETFDHWLHTKIGGYLMSRLYNGSYDPCDVLQDFTLNYRDHSWCSLELDRMSKTPDIKLNGRSFTENITVFNSSSLANQSLSRWIKLKCPRKPAW